MSRAMLLAELLPDVAGVPVELVVTGLVQDSRQLQPGDAFLAVLPARQEVPSTHGLNFAAQARAAGAHVPSPEAWARNIILIAFCARLSCAEFVFL